MPVLSFFGHHSFVMRNMNTSIRAVSSAAIKRSLFVRPEETSFAIHSIDPSLRKHHTCCGRSECLAGLCRLGSFQIGCLHWRGGSSWKSGHREGGCENFIVKITSKCGQGWRGSKNQNILWTSLMEAPPVSQRRRVGSWPMTSGLRQQVARL